MGGTQHIFGQPLIFLNINPNPRKQYLLLGKSGRSITFNLYFLGLGWPWVGEFVGFIVIFICSPTQQKLV